MHKNSTLRLLKEQERETRRSIIVDAAERVFATTPFKKVNMRDIAREAGISPASIYRYFPDQQALFVHALVREFQKISEAIDAFAKVEIPDSLEIGAAGFLDYLIERDQYFRMMTNFILDADLNPDLLDQINTVVRTSLEKVDVLFERLGAKEPRLLSHAFFAALNGILITFHNYPGRSREEVRNHMQHLGRIIASMFRAGMQSDYSKARGKVLKTSDKKRTS